MKLVLSKKECAIRELDTAIELWFKEKDIVSIHCLACSAYQIINDLNKHLKAIEYWGYFNVELYIKDDYQKDFLIAMKKGYNFVKHADRDPEEKVEISAIQTEIFLLSACIELKKIKIQHTKIQNLFQAYWLILHQEILTDKGKDIYKDCISNKELISFMKFNKKDFYEKAKLYLKESE